MYSDRRPGRPLHQRLADIHQPRGTFDVILSTVSAPLAFGACLGLHKTGDALVNVGTPEGRSG